MSKSGEGLDFKDTMKLFKEPQAHWVRIQYDPDGDHFLVDGAYSFTRKEINVDGFEANKKLQMFLEGFFHEVEIIRRKRRL